MERSFAILAFLLTVVFISAGRTEVKTPVILVPGDGGSQFEAKLDKPSVVHLWCSQKTDWFPIWLNIELLAPYVLDCFVDNMRLVYDNLTHTTSNSPGVNIRQPDFGNTSSVEWLDSFTHLASTSYFYYIAESLVEKLNYTRDVNIKGAPYDFRKAPNEMGEFVDRLGQLVEDTYRENKNRKVALIAHSMGNLFTLYMLQRKSQAWKDKFVHSFISLAGPWGGAVKTLRLMASGDNLGVYVVNPLTVRPEQRSLVSSAWMLPYDSFWNASEVLVTSPTANYTVADYRRFFTDIDFNDGYLMRQDTKALLGNLEAPNVTVHCLHGHGVKTPAALHYSKKQWYDKQPDVTYGDGDGTVNMRSLQGCLRWNAEQGTAHRVHHRAFDSAEHMEILKNKDVQAYIQKVVMQVPS